MGLLHLAGTTSTSCLDRCHRSTELLQELVKDADARLALCCPGRRAIAALEPKWFDDATGAQSTPGGDLGYVKRCLFEK